MAAIGKEIATAIIENGPFLLENSRRGVPVIVALAVVGGAAYITSKTALNWNWAIWSKDEVSTEEEQDDPVTSEYRELEEAQ